MNGTNTGIIHQGNIFGLRLQKRDVNKIKRKRQATRNSKQHGCEKPGVKHVTYPL